MSAPQRSSFEKCRKFPFCLVRAEAQRWWNTGPLLTRRHRRRYGPGQCLGTHLRLGSKALAWLWGLDLTVWRDCGTGPTALTRMSCCWLACSTHTRNNQSSFLSAHFACSSDSSSMRCGSLRNLDSCAPSKLCVPARPVCVRFVDP